MLDFQRSLPPPCPARPARLDRRAGRRAAGGGLALVGLLLATAVAAQTPAMVTPDIDPAVLARAAGVAYTREVARAGKKKILNTDAGMHARANRAVQPLISYARDVLPAAATWAWALSVETRPEAIAYCLPGGKLVVTSALFERVKLGEDEFAAIVAHVIAHALIGRDAAAAVAAYQRERGRKTPDPDPNRAALKLADALDALILSEHYDAAAEKDADVVALDLMARSGINPTAAPGAWRKLAAAGAASPQGLETLHPVTPERLAAIEAQAKADLPLYEKALVSRPPPASAPPMLRR